MEHKHITPAEGITIENALNYVDAIVNAVKRDIHKLPIRNRGHALIIINKYLESSATAIHIYKEELIKSGDATRTSGEQHRQAHRVSYDAIVKDSANYNSQSKRK